jgi:hypothetical protein
MSVCHNLFRSASLHGQVRYMLTCVSSTNAWTRLAESLLSWWALSDESMYGKFSLAAASPVCDMCEYPVKQRVGPLDQNASPVRRRLWESVRGKAQTMENYSSIVRSYR